MHGEPRFFDKHSLTNVKGFDAALIWGEDYDLRERLRKARVKEGFSRSVVYHQEVASLRQILLKNLRYGRSMPLFMKRTENLILPRMAMHALLTFVEVAKASRKPSIVLGCSVLLIAKSISMFLGLFRSAVP